MLLLDITVVNTALPAIEEDLNASFTDLQWVIDAYTLSLAALVLTAGLPGRPPRPAARSSASGWRIFTVASLAAGLATSADDAQHRPRDAGRRRRDHVRRLAGADRAGVRRRPRAGDGDGDLRRDDRHRGRDRARWSAAR